MPRPSGEWLVHVVSQSVGLRDQQRAWHRLPASRSGWSKANPAAPCSVTWGWLRMHRWPSILTDRTYYTLLDYRYFWIRVREGQGGAGPSRLRARHSAVFLFGCLGRWTL